MWAVVLDVQANQQTSATSSESGGCSQMEILIQAQPTEIQASIMVVSE